jgi:hypothetical protein|tara:strand:- start:1227 stop:1403 length:177 start_codon:yes stop_codon:yes gene_type:complete
MPKVTIDIHLPYDEMPEYEMPEDEVLIVEDVDEEEESKEIVITCPTCGQVISEDVEEY